MAEWADNLHPRGEGGRFTTSGGGGWSVDAKDKAEIASYKDASGSHPALVRDSQTRDLNAKEKAAVGSYTGDADQEEWAVTNRRLRRDAPVKSESKQKAKDLSSAISASKLSEDVVLYRAVSKQFADKMRELKPGDALVDKGFASTQTKPIEAVAGQGLMMKILAPKGETAMPLPFKNEVVLQQSSRLEFVGEDPTDNTHVFRYSSEGSTVSKPEPKPAPKPEPKPAPKPEPKPEPKPVPPSAAGQIASVAQANTLFKAQYGFGLVAEGVSDSKAAAEATVINNTLDDLKSRLPGFNAKHQLWTKGPKVNMFDFQNVRVVKAIPDNPNQVANFSIGEMVVTAGNDTREGTIQPTGSWSTTGDTLPSVLRHELGHAVQDRFEQLVRKNQGFGIARPDGFGRYEKLIERMYNAAGGAASGDKLSKYGATNSNEWFAESFALYSHPDYGKKEGSTRVDPTLEKLFDKVFKSAKGT